jgi:hypothetical protein
MTRRLAALTAFLALLAAPAGAGQLTLTMADGRVTLVADNVTIRQILAEWSRVGQTKIVNGERVPGGSVTLTFRDVPERQVLDTLLRTASGYVAAPRAVPAGNVSVFDRILILPTATSSVAAAPSTPRGGAPAGSPFPGRPVPPVTAPVPDPGDEPADDEDEEGEDEEEEDEEGEGGDAEDAGKPQLPPGFASRPGQIDPQTMMPAEGGVPVQPPAPADRPGITPVMPPGRMSPFQPIQTQRPGVFVPPAQQPGQPQPFGPVPAQKPDDPPPL